MKKIGIIIGGFLFGGILFAQTNANDTQSAIVNSLLIQQLMQMQQNQNGQNNQQNQNNQINQNNQQNQNNQINQNNQQNAKVSNDENKPIENEDDLKAAGFTRYRFDSDAEDYMVFKNDSSEDVEIEIWASDKRNRLKYYGTIFVNGRGYKGNPLDKDLDEYRAVWMKVLNSKNAVIRNLGEKHSDQYFEIE